VPERPSSGTRPAFGVDSGCRRRRALRVAHHHFFTQERLGQLPNRNIVGPPASLSYPATRRRSSFAGLPRRKIPRKKNLPCIPSNASFVRYDSGTPATIVSEACLVGEGCDETQVRIGFCTLGILSIFCREGSSRAGLSAGAKPALIFIRLKLRRSRRDVTTTVSNSPDRTKPSRRQLLQANPQRQHRDQRCHANGNANRGQRIPQNGFPQVTHGEFGQVICLHAHYLPAALWPRDRLPFD